MSVFKESYSDKTSPQDASSYYHLLRLISVTECQCLETAVTCAAICDEFQCGPETCPELFFTQSYYVDVI